MLRVGLTGGIGSGKSAVSEIFSATGVPVVDADVISRVVVEPGQPALVDIAAHFGDSILLSDGALNRRALRDIIFSDPAEKDWLESLLHPRIEQQIIEALEAATADYAVLVSPLLLETSQHHLVHRILVVDCPPETQIRRVTRRDETSAGQVRSIMQAQLDRQERLGRAHDVLSNDSDLESLREKVQQLHERYLGIAATMRDGP